MQNNNILNELVESIFNTKEFEELKNIISYQDEFLEQRIKILLTNGIVNGLEKVLLINENNDERMIKLENYKSEDGKDMVRLVNI